MEGGCHCGRVRFRVVANLDRVTGNCSICKKKGFLHLIVPPEQFQLVSGKDDLTTYEFNTKTAKHTFCKHQRRLAMDRAGPEAERASLTGPS
jgi:hypothetical protein